MIRSGTPSSRHARAWRYASLLGIVVALFISMQLVAVPAARANCLWTGTVGSWFDASNWDAGCSGVPTNDDIAGIRSDDAAVVIDGDDAVARVLALDYGRLSIRNGGTLTTRYNYHMVGWTLPFARLDIDGAGSRWDAEVTDASLGVRVGIGSEGTVKLSNQGTLSVSGLGNRLILGEYAGDHDLAGRGLLVIGAEANSLAVAPGFLDAAEIEMGRDDDGDGSKASGQILFNHTDDTGYTFAPNIRGVGSIRQEAGTTVLTGDNDYTGPTIVNGGALRAGTPSSFVQGGEFIVNGGTLQINGYDLTMSSLSGDDGTVLLGGVPRAADNVTLTIDQEVDTIFRGSITGSADVYSQGFVTLVKQGNGALTLTGGGSLGNFNTTSGLQVSGGELVLAEGGSLNGDWLVVEAQGAGARLRVVGEGSEWRGGSSVDVGSADGHSEISIEDGGYLRTALYAAIAHQAGTEGSVTLSGASKWEHTGLNFSVGSLGQGVLTILGGSEVTSRLSRVGAEAGSHGKVVIDGTGSVWSASENVFIGDAEGSSGELHLAHGGQATFSRTLLIGSSEGATGQATVTGEESALTADVVVVGVEGHGELSVTGGASGAGGLVLGRQTTGVGTALISGGAAWNERVSGTLVIGAQGEGTLTLTDGGRLHSASRFGSPFAFEAIIARDVGSKGTIRIGNGGAAGFVDDLGRISFGQGDGVLEFNHSEADYAFANSIAGEGVLRHLAGVTRLTAINSDFEGHTDLLGGKLLVDGELGGDITVYAGATLGGHGIVGSTVVNDGGTIAPGNSIGSFTIDGDLILSPGSTLAYTLGGPGTPEQPETGQSGRIIVTGDLTLDGTAHFTPSSDVADGAPGLGYYRLITYDGTLTDNGLDIGDSPHVDGGLYSLLTGAGRVDLFIAAEGNNEVQHWQGGSGVWNTVNPQWRNQDGEVDVSWAGNHAVFRHEPGAFAGGIITVQGEQAFRSLQFVDNDYELTGGALRTDGSEIRVLGDVTTEIRSQVVGEGGIVKTQDGTLILGGTNTYTGGTIINGGTLQIARDANLGDAAGGLTFRGGTLRVTDDIATYRDFTLEQDGRIDVVHVAGPRTTVVLHGLVTGSGSLHKTGVGELELLNPDNDYTGGTTIDQGMINVRASGALGTGAVMVRGEDSLLYFNGDGVSAGALEIAVREKGDVRLLNGADGGSSTFYIDEESRLMINAESSAGSAKIANAGTVIFYDAATADRAVIDNEGRVLFIVLADAGEAHIVNRDGGLVQFEDSANAAGATLLNEAGATIDIAGSSEGVSIGSLSGDGLVELGNKVLTLGAVGHDDVFAGTINGDGSLVKVGSGTLVLSGDHTYTGSTHIQAGRLQVEGALAPASLVIVGSGGTLDVGGTVGAITVEAGGRVMGTGTIGSTTVQSGAVLSPGRSFGTLVVNGDLTLTAGSLYDVEVNPDGSESDLILVKGKADIQGGSVAHIGTVGNYRARTTYRILQAEAGLSGAFSDVTSAFAFLTPELLYDYDAYTVSLRLTRNDIEFSSKGHTPNQKAVGKAIDDLGVDHDVYSAVATLVDDDDHIGDSFDSLSGEIHGSIKGALLIDGEMFRDALMARIRQAALDSVGESELESELQQPGTGESAGDWVHVVTDRGTNQGDGNVADVVKVSTGYFTGADTDWSANWITGVAFGYQRSSLDISGRSSEATVDTFHVGMYAGTHSGRWVVRTGLAYGGHAIEANRAVAVTGLNEQLNASYGAGTMQAFGELGYRIAAGRAQLEPFIGAAGVAVLAGSFTERGGASALSADSSATTALTTTVGLRAESAVSLGRLGLRADGAIAWSHGVGDLSVESHHRFAGGEDFAVAGLYRGGDVIRVELGVELGLSAAVSFGVRYKGLYETGSSFSTPDHSVLAMLGLRF